MCAAAAPARWPGRTHDTVEGEAEQPPGISALSRHLSEPSGRFTPGATWCHLALSSSPPIPLIGPPAPALGLLQLPGCTSGCPSSKANAASLPTVLSLPRLRPHLCVPHGYTLHHCSCESSCGRQDLPTGGGEGLLSSGRRAPAWSNSVPPLSTPHGAAPESRS